MRIAQSMAELIGATPLVRLNRLAAGLSAQVLAKLESRNPGGSVKDRIAASMIEAALADGRITPQSLIVEPTSGNTGIGLALICAIQGLSLVLTMPESMSLERRKLLAGYGARLVLTPAAEGMTGAIRKAEELVAATPGAFMPMQFANPANPLAHRAATALEIWDDTEGGVAASWRSGTGGTITGVGQALKARKPACAWWPWSPATRRCSPAGRPVRTRSGHRRGFVPEVLDTGIYDEVFPVTAQDAFRTARGSCARRQ
jgi:cysteine synthase A